MNNLLRMKSCVSVIFGFTAGTIALPSSAMALDHIIRPYQSARSAGMGNVRYTTGLYDENFFGNPARITENPKWRVDILNVMVEANTGLLGNIDSVKKGGDKVENIASTAGENNHLRLQTVLPAFYFPKLFSDKHALAIGLITSTQVDVSLRKNFSVDPVAITDIGPAVSYARRLNDRLTVGITGHYQYRMSTNQTFSTIDYIKGKNLSAKDAAGEGTRLDFDLGATHKIAWEPKGWKLQSGAAINNVIGGKYGSGGIDLSKSVTALPMKQPRTYNLGISGSKKGILKSSDLTTAFELTDIGNNPNGSMFRVFHLGGEITYWDWLALRTGLNQGYLCAGIGINLPLLKIDFATYGEEMSLNVGGQEDRRYALRIGFSI
jgi:hypothetical protein